MTTAGWRVPINVKLLAILAVPVLGYLVIAATAVVHAQQAANEIRDQADVVRTAVGPISLTTSLIDERTITGLEIQGLQDDLTLRIRSSTEARQATDDQLAALQTLIASDREARAAYEPAINRVVDALPGVRADIDAGLNDTTALAARYDELITGLMDANAAAIERIDDAELWQGAMLGELATRQKHSRAVLINTLIPVSLNGAGSISPQQTVEISAALGAYESRDAAIQELATGPYARPGSVLAEAVEAADLAELARNTLATGALDARELFDLASYKGGFVYDLPTGDYIHDSFRANVVEILDGEASDRTAAAARDVRIHVAAGSVGLVLTTAIVWLVSRSITRPLRSLTEQVRDTAAQRLPGTVQGILETPLGEDVTWPEMDPIGVTATDEVADVADAFNTMQQSALNLAVEEALLRRLITDSLVTLGQRNQELLDRQLEFITELERDETDPEVLADLFHLDHLANRMRRNAESLLVLAGFDPPRTWLGPTPVGDVIRAALGEAKEYQRVRVQDVDPVTIAGSATAELSHLLAELIDNALKYSPSGDLVEVGGRLGTLRDGDPGHWLGGYTITVRDSGPGMPIEEIELANHRLTGIDDYTMTPSQYMGHYIAGKLAARHGMTVGLRSNFPAKGITATVEIPGGLLTAEPPTASADTRPALPPLPRTRHREAWTARSTEPDPAAPDGPAATAPDLRLLDGATPPAEMPDTGTGHATAGPAAAGGATASQPPPAPRRSRKRSKRALTAGTLPVPPAPDEPLGIQPGEPSRRRPPREPGETRHGGPSDQADQAS